MAEIVCKKFDEAGKGIIDRSSKIVFTPINLSTCMQIKVTTSRELCTKVHERFSEVFPELWRVGLDWNTATGELYFKFYVGIKDVILAEGQVSASYLGGSVNAPEDDLVSMYRGMDTARVENPVMLTKEFKDLMEKYMCDYNHTVFDIDAFVTPYHDNAEQLDCAVLNNISVLKVIEDVLPDCFFETVADGTDDEDKIKVAKSGSLKYKIDVVGVQPTIHGNEYNINITVIDENKLFIAASKFRPVNNYVAGGDGVAKYSSVPSAY